MPGWREKTMGKIDAVGSGINKQIRAQQESASGMGVKDRWRVAQGENVRWNQVAGRKEDGEAEVDEAPVATSTVAAGGRSLPPAVPGRAAAGPLPGGGRPPPPPVRTGGAASTATAAGPPPVPSASKPGAAARAPAPALPPRMANESGTDFPPPPYAGASAAAPAARAVPALPARGGVPPPPPRGGQAAATGGPGYIEFSKFDQSEKAAFFGLLDQYFAARGGDVTPAL